MVPLNRSHNGQLSPTGLPAYFVGRLFTLFFLSTLANAEVLHFFDPASLGKKSDLSFDIDYFIANDPISIYEFLHNWSHHYHPKEGTNTAIQDMRIDLGKTFGEHIYIGYFYRYDIMIKGSKDFVDLYQKAKNKIDLDPNRTYSLEMEAKGIKQSGFVVAGEKEIWKDGEHRISGGVAASVSIGLDMQDGRIEGIAIVTDPKTYQIEAKSHYYYTHNYLYDLDVPQAYGIGYSFDAAIAYYNSFYRFEVSLVVNDILSRMYWKDLPYSFVSIETKNKSYDKDGYVKYSPVISGLETEYDYTQHIDPRYRLKMAFEISEQEHFICGVSHTYGITFPFMQIDYTFMTKHKVGLSYEARFGSVGIDYRFGNFYLGFAADSLQNASALGLRSGYRYRF
jgi:hypothetical protein